MKLELEVQIYSAKVPDFWRGSSGSLSVPGSPSLEASVKS